LCNIFVVLQLFVIFIKQIIENHEIKFNKVPLFISILIIFSNCQNDNHPEIPHDTAFYIDYRSLTGQPDGIAVIELDPDAPDFGNMSSKLELGIGVLPIISIITRMQINCIPRH
jgi:hypothetical protein